MKSIDKGIIGLFLFLTVILILPGQTKTGQKVATNTETEVLPAYPLLKGMTYVRLRTRFNGIEYYKGFVGPRETEKKEFNLEKATNAMKETGVYATKSDIQGIYNLLDGQLKKAGLRVLDIQPQNNRDTTVVPLISLNIDVLAATGDSYFALVYLTVNKWMSSWFADEEVQQSVIVWWEKDVVVSSAETLTGHVNETVLSLVNGFLEHLASVNKKSDETADTKENKEPPARKK